MARVFDRPTHRQRKLNQAIRNHFDGRYSGWEEYVQALIDEGRTYAEVCDSVRLLGVQISTVGLYKWLRNAKQSVVGQVA